MSNYNYDGTDDHMDSREIQADIEEIENDFDLDYEVYPGPADFAAHIRKTDPETADLYEDLLSFKADAQSANEGWDYGIQFVKVEAADGEWAKMRAVDLGYVQIGGMHEGGAYQERIDAVIERWPYTYIDWDAAADALHENAAEFDFRGVTYFED